MITANKFLRAGYGEPLRAQRGVMPPIERSFSINSLRIWPGSTRSGH